MKAITLYQPWATLVATGKKQIETRSWSTNYRGPLAIHASKNRKFIAGENPVIQQEPFFSSLVTEVNGYKMHPEFSLGVVVATCDLVGCVKIPFMEKSFHFHSNELFREKLDNPSKEDLVVIVPPEYPEFCFGDYTAGRYAWILANIRNITGRCIYARGGLGMWNLPADAEREALR